MKAVVAAFNQEKALVGAFSVITNLRMELLQALVVTMLVQVRGGQTLEAQYRGLGPEQQAALLGLHHDNPGDTLARRLEVIFRANGCEVRLDDRECYLVLHCQGWCGVIGYNPAPADQHPLAQHQVAPG